MTRLVKVSQDSIKEASVLIRNGELVAYPTDTVYGLGCDPFNENAVKRLLDAKNRRQGQLPLLVDNLERAEEVGRFDMTARSLAKTFWPGPLTLVVPSKVTFPEPVTGRTNAVGLRVPARKDTLDLISSCGGMIVGTSANISGNPSRTSAREVMVELNGLIELVLDGGPSELGVESSVVKVWSGTVSILRARAIGRDQILAAQEKQPS